MSEIVCVPRGLLERKPPHGSPCNNCGLCCHAKKCDIGRALFGAKRERCPALRFDADNNSSCDVIANPQDYTDADVETARAAAMLLLYAGFGCTMRLQGEMNHTFNLMLCAFDAAHRAELDHAAAIWKLEKSDG